MNSAQTSNNNDSNDNDSDQYIDLAMSQEEEAKAAAGAGDAPNYYGFDPRLVIFEFGVGGNGLSSSWC